MQIDKKLVIAASLVTVVLAGAPRIASASDDSPIPANYGVIKWLGYDPPPPPPPPPPTKK